MRKGEIDEARSKLDAERAARALGCAFPTRGRGAHMMSWRRTSPLPHQIIQRNASRTLAWLRKARLAKLSLKSALLR